MLTHSFSACFPFMMILFVSSCLKYLIKYAFFVALGVLLLFSVDITVLLVLLPLVLLYIVAVVNVVSSTTLSNQPKFDEI